MMNKNYLFNFNKLQNIYCARPNGRIVRYIVIVKVFLYSSLNNEIMYFFETEIL